MRPAELAHDNAPHVEVVEHAVNWLEASGDIPEYLLLLQPMSPLRTAADIEGIIALARAKDPSSAVGLRRFFRESSTRRILIRTGAARAIRPVNACTTLKMSCSARCFRRRRRPPSLSSRSRGKAA